MVFQRFKKKTKRKNDASPADLQAKYETIDASKLNKFEDLPLSTRTLKGLNETGFTDLTDIQKHSIHLALKGNDILGAAKTGSGKTLAFLVPILEVLYCNKWTPKLDGIGALIITPTRELAQQIYETLSKIGKYHDFIVKLIVGGKDKKVEFGKKNKMNEVNILICTPGRLLHHMDTNYKFDCTTLKILVLDEADRCLDMGFQKDMNAIIENLPPERQTLLYSATQTKSVKDLARLSLKDPLYVSVHENATHTTPEGLLQSYIVCELEEKVKVLWSFIRNHLKQKVIVFFSTCKQVKYIYEAFCHMRPGVSLLVLHGDQKQAAREKNYKSFCQKQNAVMFATDIASRGLDFPAVNWVVQMDCPEDTNAYIHRAGRTARYQGRGESLLVLLPSEEKIIDQLKNKKIPINPLKIRPEKLISPEKKLEAQLARNVELKKKAERALAAYVKSVFFMKDKTIFDVSKLNTDAFARSLGLALAPRIKILQNKQKNYSIQKKEKDLTLHKNVSKSKDVEQDSSENESSEEEVEDKKYETNNGMKKESFRMSDEEDDDDDDDNDDDILTIKRKNINVDNLLPKMTNACEEELKSKEKKAVTKAAVAKKILKKKIIPNKKINFDEEGKEIIDPNKPKISEVDQEIENEEISGINLEKSKKDLKEEDKFDKQRYKEILKKERREKKRKLKEQEKAEREGKESDEGESDAESEDSYEPDVSWLPDPDVVYKKKGSDKSESDAESEYESDQSNGSDHNQDIIDDKLSTSSDEESKIEKIHRPNKRKLVTQDDSKNKKKKKLALSNDNLETDELANLALQLINS